MELEYPENIKNSLNGIYYVKSMDKITFHSPFFVICTPILYFAHPKKCISHLPTFQLYFFHCRDNMVKINTFSMAVSSKTYFLFHFQTEICFFPYFFIWSMFSGPRKNAYCLRIFLSTSPMELEYPKT